MTVFFFSCSRSWISSTTQMHTMNECKGDSLTEQRIQSKITTVVLAIFFVSLLGVGMGQTAVYTLGIPYIDDNVASRESPLYFGENTNSSPFYRFYYIAKKRGQTGGGRGRGSKTGFEKAFAFVRLERVFARGRGGHTKIFHFDYFDSLLRYRAEFQCYVENLHTHGTRCPRTLLQRSRSE